MGGSYTGGDDGRQVTVVYICSEGDGVTTAVHCDDRDCTVELRGRWGCAAIHRRDRWQYGLLPAGYWDELSNTTSIYEAALRLEKVAPGMVAAIAIMSSCVACCFCLLLCCIRR